MTITHEYGWVHDVDSFPLGSALTIAAVEGDEVLVVVDASPFDADGGALLLNGVTLAYVAADADTDTITLAAPLVAGIEADEGDTVAVWDVDNQQVAGEQIAHVEFANGDGDDDPIPATLSTGVADRLTLGSRGGRGETVRLEQSSGEWRVVDIIGSEAVTGSNVDGLVPSPPDVTVSSSAVVAAGGVIRAVVQITWDPVDTYTDGTDIVDPLTGYEVHQAAGTSDNWRLVTSTPDTVQEVTLNDLQPNVQWSYRVRAIDGEGRVGEWSTVDTITTAEDDVPPATPSAATVTSRLGTATVTWDGKNSGGGAMDADLAYAEIHKSTVSGFAPVKGDPTTLVARLTGAGYGVVSLPYATTFYFRIIAVDTSGNTSLPSAQVFTVVTPLVNTDLIGQIIAGANIVDGSVTASEKIIGETITGTLIQGLAVDTGHLNANAVEADKIDFGTLNGELVTGLQIQTSVLSLTGLKLKNTGFEAFDGSQRTFFVNAATGGIEMKGPVVTGASITGGVVKTADFSARVQMLNAPNPLESGNVWGLIEFYNNLGWNPGRIWASESGTEGTLRIASPHSGASTDHARAAAITLISEAAGSRRMNLYAGQMEFTANRYNFTSDNGTAIDFRLFNSGGEFSIMDNNGSGSGVGNIKLGLLGGPNFQHQLSVRSNTNARHSLDVKCEAFGVNLRDSGGGIGAWLSALSSGSQAAQVFGGGAQMALSFLGSQLRVTSWNWESFQPIAASAFNVNSDMRQKTSLAPVSGALDALRAMPVYDYDTPNGQAETATEAARLLNQPHSKLAKVRFRQRGILAQDLAKVVRHAVYDDDTSSESGMQVDLYGLLSTTIAALQELDAKVERLAG